MDRIRKRAPSGRRLNSFSILLILLILSHPYVVLVFGAARVTGRTGIQYALTAISRDEG
jgi:hypothetical protein